MPSPDGPLYTPRALPNQPRNARDRCLSLSRPSPRAVPPLHSDCYLVPLSLRDRGNPLASRKRLLFYTKPTPQPLPQQPYIRHGCRIETVRDATALRDNRPKPAYKSFNLAIALCPIIFRSYIREREILILFSSPSLSCLTVIAFARESRRGGDKTESRR